MKLITIFLTLGSVLIVGCGSNRDVSTPERALIGHWRQSHKEFDENWYFFESGYYTFLWPEGMGCKEDTTTAKFVVYTQNAENRTISVDLLEKAEAFIDKIPSGLGQRLVGQFLDDYSLLKGYLVPIRNPDFKGYVDYFNGYTNIEWKYIEEDPEPGLEPDLNLHQSNLINYPTPDSREYHPW